MLNNDLPLFKILGYSCYGLAISGYIFSFVLAYEHTIYQEGYAGALLIFFISSIALAVGYGSSTYQLWARVLLAIICIFCFITFVVLGIAMAETENFDLSSLVIFLSLLLFLVATFGGFLILIYNKAFGDELKNHIKKEKYNDILDNFES